MISKKNKAIYIHIEKTGGTSIEQKLGLFDTLERGVQDHSKITYYEHIAKQAYKIGNLKYSFYCLRRGKGAKSLFYLKNWIYPELSLDDYNSFYKFTFVRNTWSRLYSYYRNVMNDPVLRVNYGLHESSSLYDFIGSHLDSSNFNQLRYIIDQNGNIPLDFIGRFERLQSDFNIVANRLDISDSQLPFLLNKNTPRRYVEFYDSKTKDLVYKLYREEIKYFNFEFED